MVVDHVEQDREAVGVTRVHQPLQIVWAPIRVVRGKQIDAVVAPPARARELRDRHQFHVCDPQRDEVGQLGDGAVERACLAERPDMELVDHPRAASGSACHPSSDQAKVP